MPVTASAFAFDGPVQSGGSRWVVETHTTPAGPRVFRYLMANGGDAQAVMTARVASVNAALAEEEELGSYERDAALALAEQTVAQFAARLRAKYKASGAADACRIAWWLSRRISAGHITDAQCVAAFGVTATQWTNFKTNTLTPQANAWAAVIAAVGS